MANRRPGDHQARRQLSEAGTTLGVIIYVVSRSLLLQLKPPKGHGRVLLAPPHPQELKELTHGHNVSTECSRLCGHLLQVGRRHQALLAPNSSRIRRPNGPEAC